MPAWQKWIALAVLVLGLIWVTVGWALLGRRGMAFGLLFIAPLIGVGVAPLLISMLGSSVRGARWIAYRDLQGRHFAYKGRGMTVHEDLGGERWIRVADLRKLIPDLPRDPVLAKIAPEGIGRLDGKDQRSALYLSARALDSYLARSQDEPAIRFRNWVRREVIFPVDKRAGRRM